MITPATSFGSAARLYDAIRPTYPAPAITWALGAAPLTVLDLGAGTGLLSEVVLAAGHDVVVVEPDDQMRAVAAARVAGRVPAGGIIAGSAEQIPLPDHSVDAVVVGQAYHWFTPERALPEIRRVLRPTGVFAPLWNVRDERTPWVSAFSAIVGSENYGLETAWTYGPTGPWLTEPELGLFDHTVPIQPLALVDLAKSRSYYLTADPAEQDRLERELTTLATTHPDLAGRDTVEMPYRTCGFRMRPA